MISISTGLRSAAFPAAAMLLAAFAGSGVAETYTRFSEAVVYGFREGKFTFENSADLRGHEIFRPFSGLSFNQEYLTYGCDMEAFDAYHPFGCGNFVIVLESLRLGDWRIEIYPQRDFEQSRIGFVLTDKLKDYSDQLADIGPEDGEAIYFPRRCLFVRFFHENGFGNITVARIFVAVDADREDQTACIFHGVKYGLGFYRNSHHFFEGKPEFAFKDLLSLYIAYFGDRAAGEVIDRVGRPDFDRFLDAIRGH